MSADPSHRYVLDSLKGVLKPTTKLKKHQIQAVLWSIMGAPGAGTGGIVADEMGLGKTLATLCIALRNFKRGDKRRILIVCPLSVAVNWEREVRTYFLSPEEGGPTVSVYKDRGQDYNRECNILITNKDKLLPALKASMQYWWVFTGLKRNALAQMLKHKCYENIKPEFKSSFTVLKRPKEARGEFDAQVSMDLIRAKFDPDYDLPFCTEPVSFLWKSPEKAEEERRKKEEKRKKREEKKRRLEKRKMRKKRRREKKKKKKEGRKKARLDQSFETLEELFDMVFPDGSDNESDWFSDPESDSGEEDSWSQEVESDDDFWGSGKNRREKKMLARSGVSRARAALYPALFEETWDHFIMDEGHFARNPDSKVSRAAMCVHARKKWILSGTPMQNTVVDLMSEMLTVGCKELPRFEDWSSVKGGDSTIVALRRKYCLRRLMRPKGCEKTHVGESYVDVEIEKKYSFNMRVPFRTLEETEMYVDYLKQAGALFEEANERRIMRALDSEYKSMNGESRTSSMHVFSLITACRRTCISPCLTKSYKKRYKKGHQRLSQLAGWEYLQSTKLYYFGRFLEQVLLPVDRDELRLYLRRKGIAHKESPSADEKEMPAVSSEESAKPRQKCRPKCKKMLVFSNFVDSLVLCSRKLDQADVGYVMITGKNAGERQQLIDDFKQDPRIRVALISTKACSEGVNMVQATRVLFLDPWWNFSTEQQAVARAHRIGQKGEVRATWMLIRGTIEESMHDVAMYKRLSAKRTMDDFGVDLADLRRRAWSVTGKTSIKEMTEKRTSERSVFNSAAQMRKQVKLMRASRNAGFGRQVEESTELLGVLDDEVNMICREEEQRARKEEEAKIREQRFRMMANEVQKAQTPDAEIVPVVETSPPAKAELVPGVAAMRAGPSHAPESSAKVHTGEAGHAFPPPVPHIPVETGGEYGVAQYTEFQRRSKNFADSVAPIYEGSFWDPEALTGRIAEVVEEARARMNIRQHPLRMCIYVLSNMCLKSLRDGNKEMVEVCNKARVHLYGRYSIRLPTNEFSWPSKNSQFPLSMDCEFRPESAKRRRKGIFTRVSTKNLPMRAKKRRLPWLGQPRNP